MLFKIFISDIQPAAGTAMNIEAAPSGKSPSTTTDSYLFYTHVSFCFALTTLLMQFLFSFTYSTLYGQKYRPTPPNL